jgi:voltage-gated potassium channel
MERHYKIIFESLLSVLIIIQLFLLVLISIGFVLGIQIGSVYNFGIYDLIISILILFDLVYFRVINVNNQNVFESIRDNWVYVVSIVPLFFICFNIFQLFDFKILIGFIGIIRIYALLKVLFITSREIRKYSDKTKLDYATFVLLFVLIVGSLLFYLVEHGVNPDVPNYESAIWYSFISMATVGYGDISPITGAGRIIGVVIILTGMGYVSLVTATLALMFIEEFRKESEKTKEEIQKRVQQRTLRYEKKIDELLEKIDGDNKEIWKKVDKIEKEVEEIKKVIK